MCVRDVPTRPCGAPVQCRSYLGWRRHQGLGLLQQVRSPLQRHADLLRLAPNPPCLHLPLQVSLPVAHQLPQAAGTAVPSAVPSPAAAALASQLLRQVQEQS